MSTKTTGNKGTKNKNPFNEPIIHLSKFIVSRDADKILLSATTRF